MEIRGARTRLTKLELIGGVFRGRVTKERTIDGIPVHKERIGKGPRRIIFAGGFHTPGWQYLRAEARNIARQNDATVTLFTTPKRFKLKNRDVRFRVTQLISSMINEEIDTILNSNRYTPIAGLGISLGARALLRSAQRYPELRYIGLNVPFVGDNLPDLSKGRRIIRVEYAKHDKRVPVENIERLIQQTKTDRRNIVEYEISSKRFSFRGVHTKVGIENSRNQSFSSFLRRRLF